MDGTAALKSVALLVFVTLPHLCFAGTETESIAAYLGAPERVQYGTEQAIQAIRKNSPQAAEALQRSLRYLDRNEVISQAAAIFERSMSEPDIRAFRTFMATPLGQRVGTTFRTALATADLDRALASYPRADLPALNRFSSSPAMAHALAALGSPEWHKTWQAYGEVLMCRYFENEDLRALDTVRQKGKCIAAQPINPPDLARKAAQGQ